MTRLLLLRHAESEWNAEGRWQGVADPPLSPRGEEQARRAGPLLRPCGISSVVSSNLRRARATAEGIVPALSVTDPIAIEPELREYDLGQWSGLTRVEIEEWRRGRLAATPDGEERPAFVARVLGAVARMAAGREGEAVLVVTHGGVISAVGRALDGSVRRYRHLSGLWVEAEPEGLRAGELVSLLDPAVGSPDSSEGTELTPVMDTPAG